MAEYIIDVKKSDEIDYTIGYDKNGKEIFPYSENCVARFFKNFGASDTYSLPKKTYGNGAGSFFNPYSSMYEENELLAKHPRTQEKLYKFVRVSKGVFEAYLRFLKTKNLIHLRHAERGSE